MFCYTSAWNNANRTAIVFQLTIFHTQQQGGGEGNNVSREEKDKELIIRKVRALLKVCTGDDETQIQNKSKIAAIIWKGEPGAWDPASGAVKGLQKVITHRKNEILSGSCNSCSLEKTINLLLLLKRTRKKTQKLSQVITQVSKQIAIHTRQITFFSNIIPTNKHHNKKS